ncbi:helix-turn-helix domain-containing protein [Janthinobacterium lividum]|nr:helix-turn-helix domain-containing protein [Janthinobacterium lividum]
MASSRHDHPLPPANDLGEFLRARRAELRPADAGLPEFGQARRVPGLRREEVAQMAAISTDYYTRLEQGRLHASRPVLAALARALRLDEAQEDYLYRLAHQGGALTRRRPPQRVGERTRRLLDCLCDAPALVLGRYMDVLAWNALGAALYLDFAAVPVAQRNLIRLSFLDPRVRGLYVDWEAIGRDCVSFLRMEAARFPDDPSLAALIGELSVHDADFRRWWAFHQVASANVGSKAYRHPLVGELTLDWQMLNCGEDLEQRIVVMTAPPGSAALAALRRLGGAG